MLPGKETDHSAVDNWGPVDNLRCRTDDVRESDGRDGRGEVPHGRPEWSARQEAAAVAVVEPDDDEAGAEEADSDLALPLALLDELDEDFPEELEEDERESVR